MGQGELEIAVIRSIDVQGKEAEEIQTLVAEALGLTQSIEETLRQVDLGHGDSLLIAGRIGGRLATMNIFMPQTFTSGGLEVLGYQSGFSATSNAYRGRGLWPKLLQASEVVLAKEGAQFIFGYPNPISHPLFRNKLGYQTIPMRKAFVPAATAWLHRKRKHDDHITPDVTQTERWKRRVYGDALVTFCEDDQVGFGLLKTRKGVRFLEVGAFDPGNGTIGSCLWKMCKATNVSLCTVEATIGSQFLPFTPLRRSTRPFIFKPIDVAFVPKPFDAFSGLADVLQ